MTTTTITTTTMTTTMTWLGRGIGPIGMHVFLGSYRGRIGVVSGSYIQKAIQYYLAPPGLLGGGGGGAFFFR